mgnify:FL=1
MEKTLSMGAFTELNEREVMETEGGLWGLIAFCVVGAVAIYEPMAQSVDGINRKTAQNNANRSGESYTVHQISIWNNITSGSTYTAYPEA